VWCKNKKTPRARGRGKLGKSLGGVKRGLWVRYDGAKHKKLEKCGRVKGLTAI